MELMIEILFMLLQLFIEIVGSLWVAPMADRVERRTKPPQGSPSETWYYLSMGLIVILAGLALGGIINLCFPKLLMPNETLRILVLCCFPVLGAFCSAYLSSWTSTDKSRKNFWENFSFAFLLLLSFELVRFIWGQR